MSSRKTAMLLAIAMVLVTVVVAVPAPMAGASYVDDFLATVGPMCTNDMRDNHILASFTLAQAIWESGWGRSTLATQANNLFGMRAYSTWDGKVYDRNECVLYSSWDSLVATKGQSYVSNHSLSFWRAYDSWQESVTDRSEMFLRLDRYANLRENYNYKSCCTLVVKDGYCTDPEYTDCLVNLIESYDLEEYNYDFGSGNVQTPGGNTQAPDGQTDPNGAETVTLTPAKLYMETGVSYNLNPVVSPSTANYTLKSSNTSVVSVSGNEVVAESAGTADVTLTSGSLSVSCKVTVKDGYGGIVADGVYTLCTSTEDTVTIPPEATKISASAFNGVRATTVIVGDSIKMVEEGAFEGMQGGFTLRSYGNKVVSDYATANAITHINISTGWILDSVGALLTGMSLYTTADVVTAYYGDQGYGISLSDKTGAALPGNAYVGTGSFITVGGVKYSAIVKGDTDGDGLASTSDLLALKGYLGGEDSYLPARAYRKAADYNSDERITTADYLAIFRAFTA